MLDGNAYKMSSDVFISKTDFFGGEIKGIGSTIIDGSLLEESAEENAEYLINDEDEAYANLIVEKAESAAIEIMDNAQNQADVMLKKARKSAKEIEADAFEKANDIFEETRQKAHEEGYNAGYQEGVNQANKIIEEALNIKDEMLIKNKDFLVDKEVEMLNLVLAISKKVLSKEISDASYIESLISNAMARLTYARDIVIRVSEADYDVVMFIKPKILAMAERIESLDIKVDHSLKRGSFVIDTASGSIDASINSQLEKIREILYSQLSGVQND